ncbi:hypothetical protein EI94DRAFT_1707972 [Lactarius quietus]|nr:hypothetical protein EI94DRAFT_1707972 [Lactarius quietus]
MSEMYWVVEDGGGKGRTPWARLKEAQGDFVLPKYLLSSITLTQYHHICCEDADALLQHWSQRQGTGEIPLQFKNVAKADWHEKQGSAVDDTSTLMGPADQSKCVLQDICKDKEQVSGGDQRDGNDSDNKRPDVQGQGDITRNSRNAS